MTQSINFSQLPNVSQTENLQAICSGLNANSMGEIVGNFAGKAVSVICGQSGYLLGTSLSYWAAPKLCFMAAGLITNPSIPFLRSATGLFLLSRYGSSIVSSVSYACAISSAYLGDRVLAKPTTSACTNLFNRINPFASSTAIEPDLPQQKCLSAHELPATKLLPLTEPASHTSENAAKTADSAVAADATIISYAKTFFGADFYNQLKALNDSKLLDNPAKQQLTQLGSLARSSLSALQQQYLNNFLSCFKQPGLTEQQRVELVKELLQNINNR